MNNDPTRGFFANMTTILVAMWTMAVVICGFATIAGLCVRLFRLAAGM